MRDPAIVDVPRKLIRPAVTLLLVATMCGCVIAYAIWGLAHALEAASFIGAPAGFVINSWFEARRQERDRWGPP